MRDRQRRLGAHAAEPGPGASRLNGLAPPQPKGIYTGKGGKLASGTDPRTFVDADWQQCEADRVRLANLDDYR